MGYRDIQTICKATECGSPGQTYKISIGGVELLIDVCPKHARETGLKHNVVYQF